MFNPKIRVLLVTADKRWRNCCAHVFIGLGCEVETVPDGLQALDSLRRSSFDVVVADDSCPEFMGPMKFLLNVRELARDESFILLGGKDLNEFRYIWQHRTLFFAGPKNKLLSMIPACVETAYPRFDRSVEVFPQWEKLFNDGFN